MKVVALFGRPNVGKSTLFNRVVGGRPAIVHARPGSTRDGRLEPVEWRGVSFRLHDTGGAGAPDASPFAREIRALAERTAARSDVVVFLADARAGLTPADEELADGLRRERNRPPVVLVANKAEGVHEAAAAEFHALGLGDPFPISAEHGLGIAEVLDRVVEILEPDLDEAPVAEDSAEDGEALRVAIVGRANVGKSTLLNRFCGFERALVSAVAGTTRDPVDERIAVAGREVVLVDTAGIRRGARRRSLDAFEEADALAVLMSEKAIRRARVSLLITDAVKGPTARDAQIARLIEDAGSSVVVLLNRWDLVTSRAARWAELRLDVRERLRHIGHAPILRMSAMTGQGTAAIWKSVFRVAAEGSRRIATPEVNRFLARASERFAPRSRRGKEVKLLYGFQSGVAPPRFRVFTNCPRADILPSYPRFLVGELRRRYGFAGTPVRLTLEYKKKLSR
ncbi:MAG: ribosome biogenesis GTPase Der [Acidobacteria bacterium]|nr:ribosome biogenesis GTPase Der [Acidobacteriota bacterium]MYA47000.1 ribosome biogenesis GTPase Der [Acidobacteriota bacterium]MYB33096.1 ribosome biogenesis GTPase Der [Acidobacteriota bacterium]MYH21759.1 ribosome biogenesis GTPase Der [Acidobacteriota bacterium]MYI40257.1 ribosome biogenesis GTPase Der [Acidobacteriota bacterium]